MSCWASSRSSMVDWHARTGTLCMLHAAQSPVCCRPTATCSIPVHPVSVELAFGVFLHAYVTGWVVAHSYQLATHMTVATHAFNTHVVMVPF